MPAGDSPIHSAALESVARDIRHRHGSAVAAILYYGSCLRSNDPFNGILDLYVLTDDYRSVYPGRLMAIVNRLLPPNVFYRELPVDGRTVRIKYNVLSLADLRRGVSGRRLHPYFWGRLVQPVAVCWVRDEATNAGIGACLRTATETFLNSVLPIAAPAGSVEELWQQGLRASYAAELRSETVGRAAELVAFDPEFYVAATRRAAATLRYALEIADDDAYTASVPAGRRQLGRLAWFWRRLAGKFLSIARLLKSLMTFDGGLDYAAWKLSRHAGVVIEIPQRVRRFPLLFVWPFLWKLYRRGILR